MVLLMNKLTKSLENYEIDKLVNYVKTQRFKADEKIIKFGDQPKYYYIMKQGKAKILVHNDGVHPEDPLILKKVNQTKTVHRGEGFGEIALFYNERRSATVLADGDCEAYIIDAKIFQEYVVMSRVQRLAAKANYLESFNLFNCLDNYQKLNLFEGF